MSVRIEKSLIVDGATLVEQSAWSTELDAKQTQIAEFLKAKGLAAVLIRRNENVAWITGGAVELRVLTPAETGVAALLVTAAGRRYYLTTANEAPRLQDEEFGLLDFEPIIFPWYEDRTVEEALKLAGGRLGSDTPIAGAELVNLGGLRIALHATEVARYRWLAAETAKVTSDVLRRIEPGQTEFELEVQVAEGLLRCGILPSVYLMAVDERIYKYKHAVARGKRLEKFAMLNLCARKWGLVVSITRFAHFGVLPAELEKRFVASAAVNAALQDASRVGATSAELYAVAKNAYAAQGFEGEEQLHHVGGATGYGEREWVATPAGAETVVNSQAFAWNPSIRGGKVEDTTLLLRDEIEVLTSTADLPVIEASVNGVSYPAAGVLVR